MSNKLQNMPIELINKAREDLLEKQECREIIREIQNFRPSQRQLIELINLLVLELENNEHTKILRNAIKEIKGDAAIIMKAE